MAIPASTYLTILSTWPVIKDERFDPTVPSPWKGIAVPATSDPLHPVIAVLFNHGIDPAVYASDSALGTYLLLTSLTDPFARNVTDFQNVHFDVLSNVLTFQTLNPLVPGSTYGATVRSSLRDAAGRGLERAYYWEFEVDSSAYQGIPIPVLLSPPDQSVVSEYPFPLQWGIDPSFQNIPVNQSLVFVVSVYDTREKNQTLWSGSVFVSDSSVEIQQTSSAPDPLTSEQFTFLRDALAQQFQQIKDIQMSLKNPAQIDQIDAQLITGVATTAAVPLPLPSANKNAEIYKRTLTANLTDFAYATTAPGRKLTQGFLNDAASGAFVYTVTAQSGDTFNAPDLTAATSFNLANGEMRSFVNTSPGIWDQL